LGVEFTQAFYLKKAYFYDKWNLVYCGSYVLNLTLVALHSAGDAE